MILDESETFEHLRAVSEFSRGSKNQLVTPIVTHQYKTKIKKLFVLI